jgi:hypothetical protein
MFASRSRLSAALYTYATERALHGHTGDVVRCVGEWPRAVACVEPRALGKRIDTTINRHTLATAGSIDATLAGGQRIPWSRRPSRQALCRRR